MVEWNLQKFMLLTKLLESILKPLHIVDWRTWDHWDFPHGWNFEGVHVGVNYRLCEESHTRIFFVKAGDIDRTESIDYARVGWRLWAFCELEFKIWRWTNVADFCDCTMAEARLGKEKTAVAQLWRIQLWTVGRQKDNGRKASCKCVHLGSVKNIDLCCHLPLGQEE